MYKIIVYQWKFQKPDIYLILRRLVYCLPSLPNPSCQLWKISVHVSKKNAKINIEGCEVRTRADKRPVDLKSTALDHSANPPFYKNLNFAHFDTKINLVRAPENIYQLYIIWVFVCKEQEQRWNFEDSLFQRSDK